MLSYIVFGEGNGTPLQHSCLENPMDGGAWWAAIHGVTKSQTRLSDFNFTFHFHALEKEMATHFNVLAWRIPGMGEPGGLPSMGSHRVGHDWSDLAAAYCFYLNMFLFILFIGFSRQEYWSGLQFPSPVDHVLSELSTMTHPSWVALQDMVHSFIELDKAVVHVISLVRFLWLWFSFCLPSYG